MFRFTREPSSGSYNHRLDKITGLVQQRASVQTLSLCMAAYCDLVCVCYTRTPGHNMNMPP